jgi:hypothetical protein
MYVTAEFQHSKEIFPICIIKHASEYSDDMKGDIQKFVEDKEEIYPRKDVFLRSHRNLSSAKRHLNELYKRFKRTTECNIAWPVYTIEDEDFNANAASV